MSNFLIYTNKLRQWVSSLAPEQAEDFINDAWRDIREANDSWSFLLGTEYWLAPGSINLTNIGVTQFSNVVTLNHSVIVSIANLNNPPITQRQLRFGLSGGPIYEIAATDVQQVGGGTINLGTDDLIILSGPFDPSHVNRLIVVAGAGPGGSDLNTTILAYVSPTQVQLAVNASTSVVAATVTWGSTITLARNFNEQTNLNANALLYRVYYSPLTIDFQRLDHLTDPITGYEFGYEVYSIDDLDRKDPQRSSVTEPYELYLHHFDSLTGLPVYELWPGPTIERAYVVTFWKLGMPFSADSDSLPPQIPEKLLLLRARLLAYEWGEVNDSDPRKRQSYASAKNYVRNKYSTEGQPGRPLGELDQAMRKDENILIQARLRPRRPGSGWPVDSNFLQRHAFPQGW
jgi:hypothetical protein